MSNVTLKSWLIDQMGILFWIIPIVCTILDFVFIYQVSPELNNEFTGPAGASLFAVGCLWFFITQGENMVSIILQILALLILIAAPFAYFWFFPNTIWLIAFIVLEASSISFGLTIGRYAYYHFDEVASRRYYYRTSRIDVFEDSQVYAFQQGLMAYATAMVAVPEIAFCIHIYLHT